MSIAQKILKVSMVAVYNVALSTYEMTTTGSDFLGSDDGTGGVKDIFSNVYADYDQIASLMGGTSYVAGLVFVFAAMLKLKQHRDNPAQISPMVSLIYLLAGVGLIYLPTVLEESADTLFTSIDTHYQGISSDNIDNNPWGL